MKRKGRSAPTKIRFSSKHGWLSMFKFRGAEEQMLCSGVKTRVMKITTWITEARSYRLQSDPQSRSFQPQPLWLLSSFWVNYNISLTWIKDIWGWCPLLTMNPVRENSEVVILYPDLLWGIYGKIYGKSMEHFWVSTKVTKVNPRLPGRRWSRSRSLDRLPVCKIGTARRRAPEVVGSWPPSLRETRV
jgi:hypothetical protein